MQNNKDFDIKKYASLAMLNINEEQANALRDDMNALLDVAANVLSFNESESTNKAQKAVASSLREDVSHENHAKEALLSCAAETEGEYISVSAKAITSSNDGKGGSLNAK